MSFNYLGLERRSDEVVMSKMVLDLLIALLVLVLVAVILIGALLIVRQRRRARKAQQLPVYNDKRISTASTASSHHRRVMVRPSESIHIYSEKELGASSPTAPNSPLPEIRITFPEEYDESGKRQSGRVVVVHVGDTGIGLEPVAEKLPTYELRDQRYHSLDLDSIGGLTEKQTRSTGWH